MNMTPGTTWSTYIVEPVVFGSISTDKPSPQRANSTIRVTANAFNGFNLQGYFKDY